MSRFSLLISLIASLFLFFNCTNIQAQDTSTNTTTTVVEKRTIVTPAPKSTKCTTVNAHWEGDVWYDTQTICTYENRTEGVAWVQDYWVCKAFDANGNCTSWEYQAGHWVKTLP